MQFQNRLFDLRRKAGLSQEQLAGLVGVTRQAVQKWESGASRPDMDNLATLARYFDVSLDWLVNGQEPAPSAQGPAVVEHHYHYGGWHYEYRSRRTLFGLPLVHVKLASRGLCVARGIVAVGNVSIGLLSVGCVALGPMAVGCFALGLLSIGCIALGLAALGCIAIGALALGGVAIGHLALGGSAIGTYAAGAAASGRTAAVGMAALSDVLAIGRDASAPAVLGLDAGRAAIDQALDQAGVPGWIQTLLLLWHRG